MVQVLPEDCNIVQSPGLQPLDHIAACQDDSRVPVFADFPALVFLSPSTPDDWRNSNFDGRAAAAGSR